MEKRGVIEDGRTPPESAEKQGEEEVVIRKCGAAPIPLERLAQHVTKRAADAAADSIAANKNS